MTVDYWIPAGYPLAKIWPACRELFARLQAIVAIAGLQRGCAREMYEETYGRLQVIDAIAGLPRGRAREMYEETYGPIQPARVARFPTPAAPLRRVRVLPRRHVARRVRRSDDGPDGPPNETSRTLRARLDPILEPDGSSPRRESEQHHGPAYRVARSFARA